MNCFSHLFTLQFTHTFVIVCFEVFHCEIHGMVPFLQINMLPFYRFGQMGMGMWANGDGDVGKWGWDGDSCMRGWMGTGTILKLVAEIGVGMGIRVLGTVGDGYKYLSPCSSLVGTPSSQQCRPLPNYFGPCYYNHDNTSTDVDVVGLCSVAAFSSRVQFSLSTF